MKGEQINEMQSAALLLEVHHSTHIKGTQLTLSEAQRMLKGEEVIKKDIIIKKNRPTGGFCSFGVKATHK
ncbi:MAG: hypothetical protein K8R25_13680 [Methanosarcinales archaeon]|nr:hypothetical protein [Methanosarcinales archaeon]